MSALHAALEKAGYRDAGDRLRELCMGVCRMGATQLTEQADDGRDPEQTRRLKHVALEACRSSNNWDGKKDALYKAIRGDAALLWELFQPYRATAVQALLTQATEELRKLEPPRVRAVSSVLGQSIGESHRTAVRRANDQSLSERGQNRVDSHYSNAPLAQSQVRAAMTAVAEVARLSLLDTFRVNGQPIGDLTPTEALKWAASRERDARFVRLLTANLPADAPIRQHRRAEDTQAIYEQASQEVGDAQ